VNDYIYLPSEANAIRQAVDEGKAVYADTLAYQVVKDNIGQYFIKCLLNNSCIYLTWRDGVTLNGKVFFTVKEEQ
jgi:hypothetical protein